VLSVLVKVGWDFGKILIDNLVMVITFEMGRIRVPCVGHLGVLARAFVAEYGRYPPCFVVRTEVMCHLA
jgi:hypothetical protein